MAQIVGFAGSFNAPSRTRSLVLDAVDRTSHRTGRTGFAFDMRDLGPSLGTARRLDDLARDARRLVDNLLAADALVVGSPVYKGSYTGLFKHLFDLIEPEALRDKPVLLVATGGGHRHALMIEHQLRPLFGFFEARVVPTGVYAASADFDGERIAAADTAARLEAAVGQLVDALTPARGIMRTASTAA